MHGHLVACLSDLIGVPVEGPGVFPCPCRPGLGGMAFRALELLLCGRLGHLPFRSDAAAGSDTSHILGGFMKLRCCAGYLPHACHGYQRTSVRAHAGVLERRADVCAGGVNQRGRRAQRRGGVRLIVSVLVEGAGRCRDG